MAILTSEDAAIYFPGLSLSGNALTGAIAAAQRLAESPKGAGRPLEQQQFTEIKKVNRSTQTVQLSYWPIADSPAPIIETRYGNVGNHYGHMIGLSQWVVRSPHTYILDSTGKLNLNVSQDSSFSRTGQTEATEVRATYTGGFDFSGSGYDVDQIKSAVSGILATQQQASYASGVDQVQIAGQATIRYANQSQQPGSFNLIGMGYKDAIATLKKYRPRAYL
jgi:hypothetical protein